MENAEATQQDQKAKVRIPASHFGRRRARWVPEDSYVRLEVRLPAPMVRRLTMLANARGASIARVVTDELDHLVGDEAKFGPEEDN